MNPPRIRIAIVINDILLGGAQSVVLNLVKLIDKQQFDPTVCYFNDYPDASNLAGAFAEQGIPVTNLGKGKSRRLFVSFFRLWRHLRRERPDIVHCCLPDAVILGIAAGRLAGARTFIIHEMNTHTFYSRKLEFFFRLARRFANVTITYSELLEEELFGDAHVQQEPITSLTRPSYTIYNGIDLEKVDETKQSVSFAAKRAELGVREDQVLIFSAARLIGWKGFEYLVRAAPEVITACSDAVILIAGSGEQEPFLAQLIQDLNLSSHVRLLGPRTDVYEILAVSDIYPQAYAYPEGVSSISISMAGMEAMAFGLPIVASRYPALYDHIVHKENAMIVEPRAVHEIAEAIIYLVRDRQERLRMGVQARAFVENYFSLQKAVLIYESLYRALVAKETRN